MKNKQITSLRSFKKYTLMEMLVATTLSALIISMVGTILIDGVKTYNSISADLMLSQESRMAREKVLRSGRLESARWSTLSDGSSSLDYKYYRDGESHDSSIDVDSGNLVLNNSRKIYEPKLTIVPTIVKTFRRLEGSYALFNGREINISMWLQFVRDGKTYHSEQVIRTPIFNN